MVVILIGDFDSGFTIAGPFEDGEDYEAWLDEYSLDENHWVATLHDPYDLLKEEVR